MSAVNAFGADARLHHIGVAVGSIKEVNPELESVHDPIQRVRVAFFRMHDLTIELIEPAGENSPVEGSLAKGVKLLHTCFEVDRLEVAIASGRAAGFQPIRPPTPATAFGGRRIAWVYSRVLGLVELLERAARTGDESP